MHQPTAHPGNKAETDGTIGVQPADMTASATMQSAMQNAGMTVTAAANTAGVTMGGMH
jgi:hypothetical protein